MTDSPSVSPEVSQAAASSETPPRPTKPTDDMKRRVAEALVTDLRPDDDSERAGMVAALVKCGDVYKDGYELAKELESRCYWDCNFEMAETLDGFASMLRHEVEGAQKQWAKDSNIQPPLPIGARVIVKSWHGDERGTIDAIYQYGPAQYAVKMDVEQHPGSRRIINYEDAMAEQTP